MDFSKDDIIKRISHHAFIELMQYGIMDDVKAAMDEYAKQEALSFSQWLSHQVINGRTITKLWGDYQATFCDPLDDMDDPRTMNLNNG